MAARRDDGDRRGRAPARLDAAAREDSGAWCRRRSASPREPPTITVDVADWVPRKLAAILCHRSQMVDGHPVRRARRDAMARRLLGVEYFPSRGHRDRLACRVLEAPMNIELLDILRCPFCGGRLELVTLDVPPVDCGSDSRRHPRMPLLHLSGRGRHSGAASAAGGDRRARAHRGRPSRPGAARDGRPRRRDARPNDSRPRRRRRRRPTATSSRRSGPKFEGGYFLYRFSDPTFIVANAVVRAVAGTVLQRQAARRGHLRRLGSPDPVADGSVVAGRRCSRICSLPKIWLGRRFTAPGCEPVCCDGNATDAVRTRRVRLRDVLGRLSVHLDQAAVRRRAVAPGRRTRRRARWSSTTRTIS